MGGGEFFEFNEHHLLVTEDDVLFESRLQFNDDGRCVSCPKLLDREHC